MRKLYLLLFSLLPLLGGARNCSVLDFGAKADGITVCTRSIQAAIDSVAASGGGMVRVPAGRFVTGSLYLKSHVELHLDKDALLMGSTNPFDYVRDKTANWTAMIFAIDQHEVAITGEGTIDGRGYEVAVNTVRHIHSGLIDDPLKYDRPNETRRPELIHMLRCSKVTLSGVTLRNPASWTQQYDRCTRLTVEGIRVESRAYWNNDGIDVVDCSEVVVRDCEFDCADDAICLKSHRADGICEKVLVERCKACSSASGIKLGTATRGIMRHMVFRNILIHDTYRSAITAASVDGAQIYDLLFDSITAVNTGNPLFLRFSSRNTGTLAPCLRDVTVRNFTAEVPRYKADRGLRYEGPVEDLPRNASPSSIAGLHDRRISNIRLEHIHLSYPGYADSSYAYCGYHPEALCSIDERATQYPEFSMFKELPAWALFIRHADSVELKDVRFSVEGRDYRPAVVCDDATQVTLDDVRIDQPLANGHPEVVANNSEVTAEGLRVSQSSSSCRSHLVNHSPTIHPWDVVGMDEHSYKASYFGCQSDGTFLNTTSIQHALNYIAAHGGGRLVFEVGRYLTGSIHIPQHVRIELREGAVLVGSSNRADYDLHEGSPRLIWTSEPGQIVGLGRVEE